MANGFFTLERWRKPRWIAIRHFTANHAISDVLAALEAAGKPGFYRVVQTQRMIWAEREDGKLRLRKWHAGSPESLARGAAAFDRDKGKWPVERASAEQAARTAAAPAPRIRRRGG